DADDPVRARGLAEARQRRHVHREVPGEVLVRAQPAGNAELAVQNQQRRSTAATAELDANARDLHKIFRKGCFRSRHVRWASTSAACLSTTVPRKKSGFTSPQKRTALVNMKSRKSSSVISPCSTSSYASGTTSAMSGTSKCPMSELNSAFRRAPSGFARRLKAHALIGSSASQPKEKRGRKRSRVSSRRSVLQ